MAIQDTVYVALLRQPQMGDFNETRQDPFWEFGSFGLSGCLGRSLLNPKRVDKLAGARLAFVQGGDAGFKLVHLTPPVTATPYADRCQVTWETIEMPFRFERAPLVVDRAGATDIPELLALLGGGSSSWMRRFASKFGASSQALPEVAAEQLVDVYEQKRQLAPAAAFARMYTDALPFNPPKTDYDRRRSFERLLSDALTAGDF